MDSLWNVIIVGVVVAGVTLWCVWVGLNATGYGRRSWRVRARRPRRRPGFAVIALVDDREVTEPRRYDELTSLNGSEEQTHVGD